MRKGENLEPVAVDLQKASSLLRATIESTTDGVLVVDNQGAVTICNGRFVDMWRIPPQVLSTGKDVDILRFVLEQWREPERFLGKGKDLQSTPSVENFDMIESKDGRFFERYSRPQIVEGHNVGRVWCFREVTERKLAEERLRESEERFRVIAENVGDLVAMLDTDGRRIYNSPSYRHLFREKDIEIGSESFREIHPEDRERIKAIFRRTVETGIGARSEFRFVLKDGSIRHIESEGRAIHNAGGKVSKVVVVSRDITERKKAEQRQCMEHGVTRVIAESETLAEAIPRIIQTICETLQWDCGARWTLDEQEKAFCSVETWNTPSSVTADFVTRMRSMKLLPGNQGLVSRVWISGAPGWIADVGQDEGFQGVAVAETVGLHCAFAFPILAGTVTLGVLEFFSREIRQPDEPLLQMVRIIGSQIGQFMSRKQAEENLFYVATHDTLTALPNRYMFTQRFTHALNHARRYDKTMALLFLDLDGFKFINDTLGHPFGDRLLEEVASRLCECLRGSDTVARFGGDEFAALIEEFTASSDLASIAQKMLDVIRMPFRIDDNSCEVTASIGISIYPKDGKDLTTLLKNADITVYRAKEQGKNGYLFYSEEMNTRLHARIALENSLKSALGLDEFVLHYQPMVNVRTRRISGVEALMRWRHPQQGLIPPAQFIGVAEETGLIVLIGAWALRTACADVQTLHSKGAEPIRVSVNLSARQFEKKHLLDEIERALKESAIEPGCLELEITESLVMRDAEKSRNILGEIKSMGIRLAIDDFGTGYSSLAQIKRFPFDRIKIDRSFIKDIPGDPDSVAITRTIIAMAHSLGLNVVAEGVETREQLDFLSNHGCQEYQGYFFCKPQPVGKFAKLLGENARAQ